MKRKHRVMMHAWYYEELIRRTEELIAAWLDGKIDSGELHEWDCNLPSWVDDTILTPDCSAAHAAWLETRLRDLVLRMDHLTNVHMLMREEPQLTQLDRHEAVRVADTSRMPLGEPIFTGPFQWCWRDQPSFD